MTNVRKYKVTCNKCGADDILTLDESNHRLVHNEKIMLSPILAVRWRADMKFGFECSCGNYDLLAEEEKRDFSKLVSGSPIRIAQIAESLKEKTLKFQVEGV